MPLIKSSSRKAIAQNIKEMRASGRPERQAVAAALHTADQARQAGHSRGGKAPATSRSKGRTP